MAKEPALVALLERIRLRVLEKTGIAVTYDHCHAADEAFLYKVYDQHSGRTYTYVAVRTGDMIFHVQADASDEGGVDVDAPPPGDVLFDYDEHRLLEEDIFVEEDEADA